VTPQYKYYVKKFLLLLSLIIISASWVKAQNGNIRGFVYTKDNGEPALFTNVYLKGTSMGIATDINGFFSITKIKAGTYTLVVTYLGYDTVTEAIAVAANQIVNKKVFLNKSTIQLTEVVATGEQQAKKENTRVSVMRIDPTEIKKLPSIGQPDLAQYLQVLPGVTFTGDQGGQLYIRGGSPVQNKVLMDGAIIYNPFHSIGLFSVFDNDVIKNADVYTAGFGAEYGGRTSSVMDITTRDGNKKRLSSNVAVSTFGAKALLEGPIIKLKENGKTSMSFIVSGKTSYLPTTSKYIYQYANGPGGLPFSYNDLYGKISLNSTNGSKISLFGFDYNDKVDYTGIATFKWNTVGGGSNFVLIPGGNNTLIEGNFAYSQYHITETTATTAPNNSSIGGFNGGFKFTNFLGRNQVVYGFELLGYQSTFDYHSGYAGLENSQTGNSTEIAGYIKAKFLSRNRKFILEPSLRLHDYASLQQISPEPRISGKYNISNRIRFKFAGGIYSQNLISASSDQDVVNLFYGFVLSPTNLQSYYTKSPGAADSFAVVNKVQRAQHLVGGFEFDLFKNIEVNIEGYQKTFSFLTNSNRYQIFNTDPQHVGYYPDVLTQSFIVETGYSRGFDITAKYQKNRFYLWNVYSFSYNRRWDGVQQYFPIFDRRNNINIVATYALDKNKHWEASVRYNFGSGFPFTPTQGYYQQLNLANYSTVPYTTQNGQLGYVPGSLFSQRLPVYARMDVSIRYKYNLKDRYYLEINGGATNVFDRANIFYFNRITYTRVNQLPIMPNLNISLKF
jgi:hypothetical protein